MPIFNDKDTLRNVRTLSLNPLIEKVENVMDPKLTRVDTETKGALLDATLDENTKTLSFPRRGENPRQINLTSIIPELPPESSYTIDVCDIKDGTGDEVMYRNIKTIKFNDNLSVVASYPGTNGVGSITVSNHGPWGQVGGGNLTSVDKFVVIDPNGKATIDNKSFTIVIPEKTPKLKAQIGGATEQEIVKVLLTGKNDTSSIMDGVLTIDLQEGGGGGGSGGITNQNFKGFFPTLGDIESQVSDAISGKSYAFAKDSKLGGEYYTPYFYVNGGWKELKQDPALTYSGPSEAQVHGVFSIKPDDRITVDHLGQIDLSKLSVPTDVNFHGFFSTVAELKKAVPTPVATRSFAYVQHVSGTWVGVVYRGPTEDWKPVAPVGTIMLQNTQSNGSDLFTPITGFVKNKNISTDSKGLATITFPEFPPVKADIVNADGSVQTIDANHISYKNGKRFIDFESSSNHITMHPAQRAFEFTANPDTQFDPAEHEAAIFFDKTTESWMGCSDKQGAKGQHWSRIAHPNMSDEVKSLDDRLPAQLKEFLPGILGDGADWRHSGWTYVQEDNPQLPEAFRDNAGAYFLTLVQKSDVVVPLERIQVCYADDDSGDFYIRRFESTGSSGAAQGWKPWVKGSVSPIDLKNHNDDYNAHKEMHKFYSVMTTDLTYAELKTDNYKFDNEDLLLIADSHGLSKAGDSGVVIPYDGSFKFSGRVEFDGWGNISTFPTGDWLFYVYKTTGSTETIIAEFSYKKTDHKKAMDPIKWSTNSIALKRGDKISFGMRCFNDISTYPDVAFVLSRTLFVVEDAWSNSGTRIANAHRRINGAMNSRPGAGVNVHFTKGSSTDVRVYGAPIKTSVDMTPVNIS